jgi:HD superfamily phosphohydrolase
MPKGYQVRHIKGDRILLSLPGVPNPAVMGRYTLVSPDGDDLPIPGSEDIELSTRSGLALGEGSYGVVLRVRDAIGIPRAIKFQSSANFAGLSASTSYEGEIQLTNASPFKNVLRILDYDLLESDGRSCYAYVMDFVSGISLRRFIFEEVLRNFATEPLPHKLRVQLRDLLFSLLSQAVESVLELHASSVVHMDIKPSNFMVLTGSTRARKAPFPISQFTKLFLTDLGAGKKIDEARVERTQLIRSERYFPNNLLPSLGHNPTLATIEREQLNKWWKYIDLFCLGKTLEEFLFDRFRRGSVSDPQLPKDEERRKEEFWRVVVGPEFAVLEMIVDELLAPSPGAVKTANDLFEILGKIVGPADRHALASPLLTDRYPGPRVPVTSNDRVLVAEEAREILDHPLFQRLKRQSQLSLLQEIFPGATHSRFAHSLLTFHLAKRFLRALNKEPVFRYLFGRREIDTILMAALLHDIGQYPFAHSLEDLHKVGTLGSIDRLRSVSYDHETFRTLLDFEVAGDRPLRQILDDLDVSSDDVAELISKRRMPGMTPQMLIGKDIINGTIDVDRLSYLRFDSHMTGVPYGKGIDLEALLEGLCIRHDPSFPGLSSLGISEMAVGAAEAVLVSVYQMYRTVYWHRTNRGVMAVLKHVFSSLLASNPDFFSEYFSATLWKGDYESLEYLRALYQGDDHNPLDSLVSHHRLGYECLLELSNQEIAEAPVEQCLLVDQENYLAAVNERVCRILRCGFVRGSSQLLWDVPLKSRLHLRAKGPAVAPDQTASESASGISLWVFLQTEKRWESIEEYSALAREVTSEERKRARKIRCFVSHATLKSAGQSIERYRDDMIRALLDVAKGFPL